MLGNLLEGSNEALIAACEEIEGIVDENKPLTMPILRQITKESGIEWPVLRAALTKRRFGGGPND